MASVADAGDPVSPTITGDDKNLYFQTPTSFEVASRTSVQTAFGAPSLVLGISNFVSGNPFVREDGQEMYGTIGNDIYRAMQGTSGFAAPTLVTELQVANVYQEAATVTPDDLVMYYASARADGGALGGEDIWVATRTSTGAPFGGFRNVAELNSTVDDKPTFITRDRCTIYFHRRGTSDAGVQSEAIWVASKSP